MNTNHSKPTQSFQSSKERINKVSSLIETISKSKRAIKAAREVIAPKGYVSIEQAAEILELSIYRTRQLQWEQKISPESVIKKERRVFFKLETIKELKIQRASNKVERSDLDLIRFAKRIVRSIETITILLESDQSISSEQRKAILSKFRQYRDDAAGIVRKSNEAR